MQLIWWEDKEDISKKIILGHTSEVIVQVGPLEGKQNR